MALDLRFAPFIARRNLVRFGPPFLILLAALALRVGEPNLVQRAQIAVFDTYQRLLPRQYDPEAPVRIVDIDEASLERLGQWPWPRTRMAELVNKLTDMGAAVVAFDIVFAEPDRTSPQQALPLWPQVPELQALLNDPKRLPDHDAILAEAVRKGRVVTGFVLTEATSGRRPRVVGTIAWSGEVPLRWIPAFNGAASTLPPIEAAAAGNGSFNMVPGLDGLVRNVPLLVRHGRDLKDTQTYLSLPAEALRVVQNQRTVKVKSSGASGETSFGADTGISQMQIGDFILPTDANGQLAVYYTGHRAERYLSAAKIFDGAVPASEVEGRIIFIGTSAVGLMDLRSSPLDSVLPGVEVHAEVVEQVVSNQFLYRPDYALGAELLFLVALGLAMIGLMPFVGVVGCAVVGVVSIAAACGFSWYGFAQHRVLTDPVYPSAVAMVVYFTGSLITYFQTEGERRRVRGAFSQYMSPALVKQLADNPQLLKLGGETKTMTMLFCDVRGFTAISERFKDNPHGLTDLINRLLTPLTDVILSRDGTIDKYMGDAIMAFWNAPLDVPDHAVRAVDAALDMFVAMEVFNERRRKKAEAVNGLFRRLDIGIGINSGACVVGNMGSKQRFDYSVLGDCVNLASRLEGQSKSYGVGLVIGEATVALLGGPAGARFALLELDSVAVKGKEQGVRIYTALGREDMLKDPVFIAGRERHQAMLAAYRIQAWDTAEAQIAHLMGAFGGAINGYYSVMSERIAVFRQQPPGPDWDGIYRAETK